MLSIVFIVVVEQGEKQVAAAKKEQVQPHRLGCVHKQEGFLPVSFEELTAARKYGEEELETAADTLNTFVEGKRLTLCRLKKKKKIQQQQNKTKNPTTTTPPPPPPPPPKNKQKQKPRHTMLVLLQLFCWLLNLPVTC